MSLYFLQTNCALKKQKRFLLLNVRLRLRCGELGSYKIRKSLLRNFFKDPTDMNRTVFLEKLERDFFLYEEDKQIFLNNKNAFEALICALSAYYYKNNSVEKNLHTSYHQEGNFSLPLS